MTTQPNNQAPDRELPIAGRDDLLGSFVRRFAYIPVPAAGKRFRVRNLSELERSQYENSLLNAKGRLRGDRLLEIKVRMIQIAVVDDDGKLLYGLADVPQLIQQDSQVIDQLVSGIKLHCGFSDDDLEGLEKNYGAIPVDDSR